MDLNRVLLSLVSITLAILGLAGETGSTSLSFLLVFVFVVLFLPPLPKHAGQASSKANVVRSFLVALQLASVAWLSVIATGWLVANWVKAEGTEIASRTSHELIVDWNAGIRPIEGLRPLVKATGTIPNGSHLVHASPDNGTWLIPLQGVLQEVVDDKLNSFENYLLVIGVVLGSAAFFIQALLNSGPIVPIKR